jgi:hypothetical protein
MFIPVVNPSTWQEWVVAWVLHRVYRWRHGQLVCRECGLPVAPETAVTFTKTGCLVCSARYLRWERRGR